MGERCEALDVAGRLWSDSTLVGTEMDLIDHIIASRTTGDGAQLELEILWTAHIRRLVTLRELL